MLPPSSGRPDWFARLLEAVARKRDEHEQREPIVLVVDGLDEAESEPGTAGDRGLPLGLPASLPDGVYVVTTSRFGIEGALHAIRNPADWLQIEVAGQDNLEDMCRFINDVTSPDRSDSPLVEALRSNGVDLGWFRLKLAEACAGVWIYLRYVLDEIPGQSDPRSVAYLPSDLAGYYAQQIKRWRGPPEDEPAERRWEQVKLPLLGVLAAARAPLTVAELASFGGVASREAARAFIEETARAFLSRREDQAGPPRYALRHQSLRDLLSGRVPAGRPDMANLAHMCSGQVRLAHRQIATALTPPGAPHERDWASASPYTRGHLAAHAAACSTLDSLVCDPGFLLTVDPDAVQLQRGHVHTTDGKSALAAFDLCLDGWESSESTRRLARLEVNAARVRASALAAACAARSADEWQISWSAWKGQSHRRLTAHTATVTALAMGRAGDRDVIVSGSEDGTVRVWDAVTGDPVGEPVAGHDGGVNSVVIGPTGDRDMIASISLQGAARMWDAVTGDPVEELLAGHDGRIHAMAIGRVGDRDVIVSGSEDGMARVRDAATGDPVGRPLAVDDDGMASLAIGRAGDRDVIVSGSRDRTVRVWDAVTGDPVGEPLARSGPER